VFSGDLSAVVWRKAAASNASGNCVEVAILDRTVAVRDTKDAGGGPVLFFTSAEWRAFLDGAKGGEFDL